MRSRPKRRQRLPTDARPMSTSAPIAGLGAGSWGTALAIQFARGGRQTRLWGRNAAQLRELSTARRNQRYLPEGVFPASLTVSSDLAAALSGALDILLAVPS